MAKTILVFTILLLSNFINAQNTQFGIRVEPQINWFSITAENCYANQSKAGISIGLVLDQVLSENYYFNTGIIISQTGGAYTCGDSITYVSDARAHTILPDIPQNYSIKSLQLPIGLKFKTGGNQRYTYYGEIGIDLLLRIQGNLLSEEHDESKYNISEEIRGFNFGYHVGGGLEFYLNDRSFVQVGVNFTQGLINVLANDDIKLIQNMANLRLAVYF